MPYGSPRNEGDMMMMIKKAVSGFDLLSSLLDNYDYYFRTETMKLRVNRKKKTIIPIKVNIKTFVDTLAVLT